MLTVNAGKDISGRGLVAVAKVLPFFQGILHTDGSIFTPVAVGTGQDLEFFFRVGVSSHDVVGRSHGSVAVGFGVVPKLQVVEKAHCERES